MPNHTHSYADPLPDLTTAETDSAVAADLARRATTAGAIAFEEVEAGLVVRLRRHDETIEAVDLERFLDAPRAQRGAATLVDPAAFAEYVKRLGDDHTTVWADADHSRIVAVFNDHAGAGRSGWRDHTATLHADVDPDWQAWFERSGKLGSQEWFAEWIEEHYSAIDGDAPSDGGKAGPSAADMLEIATTFQARRTAAFERATRLQSGDVQLRFEERTTASAGTKGTVEVPTEFAVRLRPYRGVDPVRVRCLLRYRIRDGVLTIGYVMHRAEDMVREAFTSLTTTVSTGLADAAPMYHGTAPLSLRPAR